MHFAVSGSLWGFACTAVKTGDLARILPLFHPLCSHSILKTLNILTQIAILSFALSKSDRLPGWAEVYFGGITTTQKMAPSRMTAETGLVSPR